VTDRSYPPTGRVRARIVAPHARHPILGGDALSIDPVSRHRDPTGMASLPDLLAISRGWDALAAAPGSDAPEDQRPFKAAPGRQQPGALAALLSRRHEWADEAFEPSAR